MVHSSWQTYEISRSPLSSNVWQIKHLDVLFAIHRHRFITILNPSGQVDLIRSCPGGSIISLCVVKVLEARLLWRVRLFLMEFHMRAHSWALEAKLQNMKCVLPSVADMFYKELAEGRGRRDWDSFSWGSKDCLLISGISMLARQLVLTMHSFKN